MRFAIHEEHLWMPFTHWKRSSAILGKSIIYFTPYKENTR